nr:hypothetical protein CFP56_53369 [Quercus suber]
MTTLAAAVASCMRAFCDENATLLQGKTRYDCCWRRALLSTHAPHSLITPTSCPSACGLRTFIGAALGPGSLRTLTVTVRLRNYCKPACMLSKLPTCMYDPCTVRVLVDGARPVGDEAATAWLPPPQPSYQFDWLITRAAVHVVMVYGASPCHQLCRSDHMSTKRPTHFDSRRTPSPRLFYRNVPRKGIALITTLVSRRVVARLIREGREATLVSTCDMSDPCPDIVPSRQSPGIHEVDDRQAMIWSCNLSVEERGAH